MRCVLWVCLQALWCGEAGNLHTIFYNTTHVHTHTPRMYLRSCIVYVPVYVIPRAHSNKHKHTRPRTHLGGPIRRCVCMHATRPRDNVPTHPHERTHAHKQTNACTYRAYIHRVRTTAQHSSRSIFYPLAITLAPARSREWRL